MPPRPLPALAVRPTSRALLLAGAVAALATPASARAQAAAQPNTVARADSLLALGDTAGALSVLAATVRLAPTNAAAWHRQGSLAAERARGRLGRNGRMDGIDDGWRRLADSSLRLATRHAPDSARYWLALGRFKRQSTDSARQASARSDFDRALALARRHADSALVSDASDAIGMVHWSRFEIAAERQVLLADSAREAATSRRTGARKGEKKDKSTADESDEQSAFNYYGFAGELDYLEATDQFAAALFADPLNDRARRHVYMSLATYGRWSDLRLTARDHLRTAPWDPWAWMALGLASHRLGQPVESGAAFDSALVFLTIAERERLLRLSRVLREEAALVYDSASAPERAAIRRAYWLHSDPFWTTPGNERWLEFMSRVAYSEFRWTSEEHGVRGAETDRGQIHVRFGPPPRVAADPPDAFGVNTVRWGYGGALLFTFKAPPGLGLARLDQTSADLLETMRETLPVRWANLDAERRAIDIEAQAARFRVPGAQATDSSDLLVLASVPLARIAGDTTEPVEQLDHALFVLDGRSRLVVYDSTRERLSDAPRQAHRARMWRRRIPSEPITFRLESIDPETQRGARATGVVDAAPGGGFDVSDVLLARCLRAGGQPTGWRDFSPILEADSLCPKPRLALLWEVYELADGDLGGRHAVRVTINRLLRERTAGPLVVKVAEGPPGAVGVQGRGNSRVTLEFTVQSAPSPVSVEHLLLDLGTAKGGRYAVTLEVTDASRGVTVARSQIVTLPP